ncbi:MAG TPA: urease accessory UreF family protein, partial [Thermoanaerobaculia bacterium]|nr:urease accessory UreF family protein [Thermoanaerobaculia bacterium]
MAEIELGRAPVIPLIPCAGGAGRGGVARDLATVGGEPLPSSAKPCFAGPSSAISPARGERGPAASEGVSGPVLQRLLAWLSPSFPVGAYSYSHGLEWAVEDGTVTDATTLSAWVGDILRHGAGRSDAVLFAHAYRAACDGDAAALRELIELAAAFQPSKERRLEATAQGQAFLSTIAAAWPAAALAELLDDIPQDPPMTYALAVAITAAAHAVPLAPALTAYLAAFVANLVSAGVRAIPIGQTDGQRIIATTAPSVEAVAGAALSADLDALGGAALRADVASMKH